MQALSRAQRRALWITLGVTGGVAMLSAGAIAVWNSTRMRALRATRRAGRLMNKVGTALQSLSTVVEN